MLTRLESGSPKGLWARESAGPAEILDLTPADSRSLSAGDKGSSLRYALLQRPVRIDDQLRLRNRLERGFEALIELERAGDGRRQ